MLFSNYAAGRCLWDSAGALAEFELPEHSLVFWLLAASASTKVSALEMLGIMNSARVIIASKD